MWKRNCPIIHMHRFLFFFFFFQIFWFLRTTQQMSWKTCAVSRLSAGYRCFESHCVWTVWQKMCCALTDCSENTCTSSPLAVSFPNGFWELVLVARHYIANSFDLHRDSTRRLIVTSRVSGRKRRVSLWSQAVTGVTSIAAWRPGPRRTNHLCRFSRVFQSSSLRLTLAN